ncbi:Gpi1 protein of GPI synthesis [Candida orthopsilosis Co 90-125]|uniref:Gpi1 protein of GPI synthesis n=1 Tax=Candida orthopsilosis (strain 90-125) TaxID=1136231 RepID=H8X323_CANO9|nr:Gpi1 protein of GPI synthesis [Candida orthopsilosis Co 90-125]CCG25883.1 Gpi1 protein of GPI synthesis [Candida orthopsilosis Co 90-125]
MNFNESRPVQIYFPNDLKRYFHDSVFLLGYEVGNAYVIFQCARGIDVSIDAIPELKVVGTINHETMEHPINLHYDEANDCIWCPLNPTIVYFDPPNFRNLEYFSIEPILLQSMEKTEKPTSPIGSKLDAYQPEVGITSQITSIANEAVLEKINSLYKTRTTFKRETISSASTMFHSFCKWIVLRLIIPVVKACQTILILSLSMINFEICGYSLVRVSKCFRQLDLRLKQLNYFPVQFLCYYDRNVLYQKDSQIINELKLPIFNSNLNINNSNYINLYNSLWLIFNDILLGITVYGYIDKYQDQIFKFIQSKILEKYLYNELVSLITWVSTENPAGFKLNTDLGKFLGDLYIWTILFWKDFVENVQIVENKPMILKIFKILCYGGGCSFLLSSFIDCIQLSTFHIYTFYYCAGKIYKRQLEIIKSLFQLFRGKKYNVLRNRIDNLNNYETGDIFEVDQLLLGTLLFMIMIFLLPTTFAFYLTFSIIHILILMAYNLLENITIILNFTPIFVCLLKFKNSKRLQGGIKFQYENSYKGTTFLSMSNKSLTYQEIFVNYVKLFQRSKNFRHSIVQNLSSGYMISFKYDYNLKFLYLMLPEEYAETISIWKYVK